MNHKSTENIDVWDDIDIALDENDWLAVNDEAVWSTLIEEIRKGNVIPVLGGDVVEIGGKTSTEFIVNTIARQVFKIKEPVDTFKKLLSHHLCTKPDLVRGLVVTLINKKPELFEVSALLKELLEIKYFKFVITTTIDPVVENTMRSIHKEELRVLSFYNSASYNQDIDNSYDTGTPTLYYMFGNAHYPNRDFVISENDLLRFSRSWLLPQDSGNNAKPKYLSNALSEKYLLVLGNNFQEWFFRFFWYAMKNDKLLKNDGNPIGMETLEKSDDNIVDFLNNSNISTKITDLKSFISELKFRIAKIEENEHRNEDVKFDVPQLNYDVFISYSRADSEVVEKLYEKLTEKGVKVWFDKKNLGAGDMFMNEIRNAIRTCKLFVPVLSEHIIGQADKEHVYRLEWLWAIEHRKLISSAVHYIVPFAERNLDLYNMMAGIPEELKQHNVIVYDVADMDSGVEEFVGNILMLLNKN